MAEEMPPGNVLVHTVFREHPFEMPADEAEVLRKRGLVREAAPQTPSGPPPDPDGPPPGTAKPSGSAKATAKETA